MSKSIESPYSNRKFLTVQISLLSAWVFGGLMLTIMSWDTYLVSLIGLGLTFHCATICSITLEQLRYQDLARTLRLKQLTQERNELLRSNQAIEYKLNLILLAVAQSQKDNG
jgi:hypothetical protein